VRNRYLSIPSRMLPVFFKEFDPYLDFFQFLLGCFRETNP